MKFFFVILFGTVLAGPITNPGFAFGGGGSCGATYVDKLISLKCTREGVLTNSDTGTGECIKYLYHYEKEYYNGPSAAPRGPDDGKEICTKGTCQNPKAETVDCEQTFGLERLAELRATTSILEKGLSVKVVKNFESDGSCSSSSSSTNGQVTSDKKCYRTASYTAQLNEDCKKYKYSYNFREISPIPEGVTMDANNGKELCTFEKCEEPTGAQPIECSEAFDEQQLAQIREKGNN